MKNISPKYYYKRPVALYKLGRYNTGNWGYRKVSTWVT